MSDTAARLFERVQGETLPAHDLVAVHRRAARLQHRRKLGAVAVTACAVATVIGAVQLLGPTGARTGTSAASAPAEHREPSADGLLLLEDLGPGGWVSQQRSDHTDAVPDVLPSCTIGPRVNGKHAAATILRRALYTRGPMERSDWWLTETVLRPEGDAKKITEDLRQLATCTSTIQGPVLAASDTTLLVGDVSSSGDLDGAHAYIWADGQLLVLSIRSQPSRSRTTGIPGGTTWLARLAATAAERATGKPATPPSIRADAPGAHSSPRPS